MTTKPRHLLCLGALLFAALLANGCASSSRPLTQLRYGPSTYDSGDHLRAIVRITDTNYPALLRGKAR
jgi:hypothetical protein